MLLADESRGHTIRAPPSAPASAPARRDTPGSTTQGKKKPRKEMQCIPRRRRNLDPVKGLTVAAETTETPKPAVAHAVTAGSAAARRRMAYPYCCTLVLASSKHSGSAEAIWKRPCSPLLRLSRGSIISGGSQAGGGGGDGAGEREAEAKASPSSRGLLLLSASAVGNTAVGVATGEARAGRDSSNCTEGTRVPLRSFRRTHCDSLSTIEERYSAGSGSMRNTSPAGACRRRLLPERGRVTGPPCRPAHRR
mmetsp:Transcript_34548/g.102868  ORF Transcript_34548/g.102868 Transcript_34548/m.102868 type:complete len:251 (+) Transcript_34548:193-945(+)